jgi:hypothetical protein
MIVLISLQVYIDFFGLSLSYAGTWGKLFRSAKYYIWAIFTCCGCCSKMKAHKEDNYKKQHSQLELIQDKSTTSGANYNI